MKVKLQFFKTFLLPHFDYCSSLFVYFCKTLIEKIRKLYNSCLFNLLNIELSGRTLEDQACILKPFNLLPFYYHIFYSLSIFYYKILNNRILNNVKQNLVVCESYDLRTASKNLFLEPFCRTVNGSKRLSIFLPKFCIL